jgi:copper chaperone CopZ
MKSIKNILMLTIMLVSFTSSYAQIKNSKTDTAEVFGNCGMCKKTIEKAGTVNKESSVIWDKDTKIATITYDDKKTNKEAVLKKIALAGYDNASFLAPDDVYNNLPGCCQYDRVAKTPIKDEMKSEIKNETDHSEHNINAEIKDEVNAKMESKHDDMKAKMESKKSIIKTAEIKKINQLDVIYENYFAVKDALVKTDGNATQKAAKALAISIDAVKMNELKMDVHMVWMKVMKNLKSDATAIANSKDTKKQRAAFDTLSENIYKLIKVSKTDSTVYLQHCPMANDGKGANWLSKENTVKNPYYGSMMLSCGKTVETIK